MSQPLKMVALTALLYLLSCQADPETWQRGTAKACDSCTSDLDCAAGLLCDQDAFACKSVDQLKAKKTNGQPQCDADCWFYCQSGACSVLSTVNGAKCAPKSAADCAGSAMCKANKSMCNFDPAGPACVQ